MHAYPAILLGVALWLIAFVCWPNPYMILMAPLVVSTTVLVAAVLPSK